MENAIKEITSNWEELYKKQNDPKSYYSSKPRTPAVWVAKSDTAGSYEVDEEWIGISPQGNIVWAYASGCSCWDGDYTEETKPTLKEVVLEHKQHAPEVWEKAIEKFAETKEIQDL